MCASACVLASGCVKAWLEPADSQEDRRGSRWICLDLTLPTPFRPPGPPLPTCRPLCRIEGREQSLYVCVCERVGGRGATCQPPERVFPDGLCVCRTVLTRGSGLRGGTPGLPSSSAVSVRLSPPCATGCCLLFQLEELCLSVPLMFRLVLDA